MGDLRSAKTIGGALRGFVERGVLAGAVTVVANEKEILGFETVGFADVAARKPMRRDTMFWIASQTKPVTGAAFMMLVDEGKVKVDDPVVKYLPGFKEQWVVAEQDGDHVVLKRPRVEMTVRHILCHMGGLAFRSPMEEPTVEMLPLENRVRGYAAMPRVSEAGEKYLYSNEGINVVGRIVELVSGQAFGDFVQERIFGPLGMRETTFWPSEEQVGRLAKGYRADETKTKLEETRISQLHYPLSDPKRQVFPGGGLFSTADDMLTFCRMVMKGGEREGRRYLSENAVREMTRRQTPAHLAETYGLGWKLEGKKFGHPGAMTTKMLIDPERQIITLWLVQHDGFPGDGDQAMHVFEKMAGEMG